MAINECYKMAAKLRAVIEEKKDEYFGLNIDDILVYFNSELFKTALEEFIKHETFSCKGILRLFEPVMNSVAGNNAPESWLEYCYYFSLNKSFPQAVPITLIPELNPLCSFYLDVLRQFFEYECLKHDKNWQEKNTIKLLDDSEVTDAGALEEYSRFRDAFYSEYVYEMMKLAEEVTGHSTLDHICGVHYLALYIGRQLHEAGIPIDLGRVSGSAAGHDIGKYGCKESEHARVPYLHYYYTDYWFKKHSLNNIGHIAVNHSTWDLELENLPVESLVLIYSDFRVKSIRDKDNKKVMCIFSLAEAFEVIFNKLDNMTEEKKQRYHKVYEKIMDFEKYMLQLGIDTTVTHKGKPGKRKKTARLSYTTMQGSEIVSSFKYYAINHNIRLMHRLKDEHSLSLILEAARNESDWKNLREYIRIFEEYSTYLTQKQKLIMLRFLYSLLEHPEDDIRRHCAELIGLTIAMFDEDYRKEIPKDEFIKEPEISSTQLLKQYLQSFLYPDTKIPALHRGWISYSTGMMVNKLFAGCRARQLEAYRDIVLELYTSKDNINEQAGIYLLDVARYIPIKDKTEHISILI
ncbi:MAG: cytidyltransferase, partial [Bacillota bacterium]